MLRDRRAQQSELEMVTVDELVPQDHLLRKIDRYIDFSFIHERVRHLYSQDNGRPAVDPEQLFRMLFIGYLYGIRSERQLVREIQVNVAYRWFLRMNLTDKVIDASTFSQNRRRRFDDSDIEQQIFDEIVLQAIEHGLVGGKVLYTDSTHLKANANKNKFAVLNVEHTPLEYLEQLEQAVNADRQAHGVKTLKANQAPVKQREIKVSRTDPDSGFMTRDNKPKGFFYLDHRTVDGRYSIITDSYATPGNVHDTRPYLGRLDRQVQRFKLTPIAVGLDAGYHSAPLCKGLEDRQVYAVIGYRRPNHRAGMIRKREFLYDKTNDCYLCPANQIIAYRLTGRDGYRRYHSDPSVCKDCELRDQCTGNRKFEKILTRHVWADSVSRVDSHRLEPKGKKIYERRKQTVERSFADAKQLHGQRYARFRGLNRVQRQCLLAAACQNMKKMALILAQFLRQLAWAGRTKLLLEG